MNASYRRILIKTRRQVFSEVTGNNASLFQGEGYDFSELREYEIGDDIRKIDWIITAKHHKPYVKLFHAERELHAGIVTMLNGGSYFGSVRSKQEVIAEIASILAFSAIKNMDLFSHFLYADTLYKEHRPSKRIQCVQRMLESIQVFNPLGKCADYAQMAKMLFDRIKRRSLLFIVGDFFAPVDFRLLAKKHEVIVIMVRDRLEERPPNFGSINLIDPETGEHFEGNLSHTVAQSYYDTIQYNDRKFYQHCHESCVRCLKIYTQDDPFIALRKLFAGRIS
jgi:uncharacterized protein (DUF58 family)